MAKMLNYAKITLDSGNGEVYTGDAGCVGISSTNGGVTHSVSLGPVYNLKKEAAPVKQRVGGATHVPGMSIDNTKRDAVLKHVMEMAKLVDKQSFESARLIEQAIEDANTEYNRKVHQFQLAVLSASHEGIGGTEVKDALTARNLTDFEDIVDGVTARDYSEIYLTTEDVSGQK
jgi:hypothetical protein